MPSLDFNNPNESEIKLNNVIMTLVHAYYLILLLNFELNAVLIFWKIILLHDNRQIAVYICRNSMTIILYFTNNLYAGESALPVLQNSLYWFYQVDKNKLIEYLDWPAKHILTNYIVEIIQIIKVLNNKGLSKIKRMVLMNIFQEIGAWVLDLARDKINVSILNNLALNNCKNSMAYVFNFISMANQSLSSYHIIDYPNDNNNNDDTK